MAALAGRKVRVKVDDTAVAGARTDNLSINREHIDSTDKDDEGVRQLLDTIGVHSISMTCSGILKDATLAEWASDPETVLQSCQFEIDGIGTFEGDFGMSAFEIGGEDGANAATFSATFESAGSITFTAATP